MVAVAGQRSNRTLTAAAFQGPRLLTGLGAVFGTFRDHVDGHMVPVARAAGQQDSHRPGRGVRKNGEHARAAGSECRDRPLQLRGLEVTSRFAHGNRTPTGLGAVSGRTENTPCRRQPMLRPATPAPRARSRTVDREHPNGAGHGEMCAATVGQPMPPSFLMVNLGCSARSAKSLPAMSPKKWVTAVRPHSPTSGDVGQWAACGARPRQLR